jgi:hypothetical protein
MNHFLALDKTNGFPNEEIKAGIYQMINKNLTVLAERNFK